MIIVGIDPGLGGAIARLDTEMGVLSRLDDCPSIARDRGGREVNEAVLATFFKALVGEPCHVFLERAQAMPKQGVSSCFNYGAGYGIYRGIVAAFELPLTLVSPAKWKREMNIGSDKGLARRRASQLFPASAALFSRKKDDGRAEAALIAYFGAQQLRILGEVKKVDE